MPGLYGEIHVEESSSLKDKAEDMVVHLRKVSHPSGFISDPLTEVHAHMSRSVNARPLHH
jgi:hypothetical protein